MRTKLFNLVHVWGWSLVLLPAACAQSTSPTPPTPPAGLATDPPGAVPEQPKGDLGEALEMAEVAADARLEELLKKLDLADHETAGLRTSIMHVSINFITDLTQTRLGTLTLRTDWNTEHASGLPLRQFRVNFDRLILEQRVADVNTSYIFDGEWLAEKIADEKQFNKYQVVRPGERFDPMDKMHGMKMWLPIGQDVGRLRAQYHTAVVDPLDYFADEDLGDNLRTVVSAGAGSVQLRLNPRDPEDPTKEIRMWFDAETFVPRAHAELDGEGVQVSTLFGVERNPGDIAVDAFDTTTPAAAEGWDATIRPMREAGGGD